MMTPAALVASIEAELYGDLLPFWRERGADNRHGGFIAEMAQDGSVRQDATRGLVLHARLLWTFATLHRHLGDARDLSLARRAAGTLEASFLDREHDGYLWTVDPEGRPLDRTKKIYGQAFCVYALSEYHLATGEAEPLAAAHRLYELIERHAHNPVYGGYLETLNADWSPSAEQRLSARDMPAARSMNNHLHLLETWTLLYRAWPDPGLASRLVGELIEIFGRHMLDRGPGATPAATWRPPGSSDWSITAFRRRPIPGPRQPACANGSSSSIAT